MVYIIYFDIAAFVIVFGFLAMYIVQKRYPTKSGHLFLTMSVLLIIGCASDIIASCSISYPEIFPIFINVLTNTLYQVSHMVLCVLFYIYVLIITKGDKINKAEKCTIWCSALLVIAIPIINLFAPILFKIGDDGSYTQGPCMMVFYVVAFAILIYSAVLLVRNFNKLYRTQAFAIASFIISIVVAVIIQIIFPGLLIETFVCSIVTTVIYVNLENPADYLYMNSACYNEKALLDTIKNLENKKQKFETLAFAFEDSRYISSVLKFEILSDIFLYITVFLQKSFGERNVFYIDNYRFVVILNSEEKNLNTAVNLIKGFFTMPIRIEDLNLLLKPYFCVMSFPEFKGTSLEAREVINYALDHNELAGETGVIFAKEELVDIRNRKEQIIHILRDAIKNDGFDVFYQPIYSNEKKKFVSCEALVRLNSTEIGFIGPDEFIPIAENNGLILEMGLIIFRKVCAFYYDNNLKDLGVEYIEVNLSMAQCVQNDLPEKFLGIMQEFHVQPECINLEITETVASIDDKTLKKNMRDLKRSGCSFSLDDYGTGFSTANYLVSMPFEIVKIDKSILWPAMENDDAFVVLKHTIKMIKELNKKCVVEGVETEKMRDRLNEMGVDFLQGYLFSKPVCGRDYIEFLNRNI